MVSYYKSAERPSLRLWLLDDERDLIDFSTGYTFSLKIGSAGSTALLTKSSGITGAAGAGVAPSGTPNVTVEWTAGELSIAAGNYTLQLTATTGGLDRLFSLPIQILDTVT